MARAAHTTPSPVFQGFPAYQANVTYVPIQFFTVVLPRASRGCVRLVGYALRKLLETQAALSDLKLNVFLEVSSVQSILDLVAAGHGDGGRACRNVGHAIVAGGIRGSCVVGACSIHHLHGCACNRLVRSGIRHHAGQGVGRQAQILGVRARCDGRALRRSAPTASRRQTWSRRSIRHWHSCGDR